MTVPTTVVHVRDVEVSRGQLATDAVYIGRAVPRRGYQGSKWGNPYRFDAIHPNADDVLDDYRAYVLDPDSGLLDALPELVGKRLACWCKKKGDEPCHGDVLVDLLREMGLEP